MRVWDVKIGAPDASGLTTITVSFNDEDQKPYRVVLPPDVIEQFRGAQPPGRVRGDAAVLDNAALLDAAADRAAGQYLGERLLATLLNDRQHAKDHGRTLIEALKGERTEGSRVWLRLDVSEAGPLSDLPWELMYAPDERVREYLATSEFFGLSRYRKPLGFPPPPAATLPLQMLLVVADPTGLLDTAREVGNLRRAIAALAPGTVELRELPGATRPALARAVNAAPAHVIHYIGHGSFDGATGRLHLHVQGKPGETDHVDAEGLSTILKNDRPWLIFLNACEGAVDGKAARFGGLAQELLGIGIPFVIAMRRAISDVAAQDFATSFYRDFTRMPLSRAVARARNLLLASNEASFEFATPALFSSLAGDDEDADRIPVAGAPVGAVDAAASAAAVAAALAAAEAAKAAAGSAKESAAAVAKLTELLGGMVRGRTLTLPGSPELIAMAAPVTLGWPSATRSGGGWPRKLLGMIAVVGLVAGVGLWMGDRASSPTMTAPAPMPAPADVAEEPAHAGSEPAAIAAEAEPAGVAPIDMRPDRPMPARVARPSRPRRVTVTYSAGQAAAPPPAAVIVVPAPPPAMAEREGEPQETGSGIGFASGDDGGPCEGFGESYGAALLPGMRDAAGQAPFDATAVAMRQCRRWTALIYGVADRAAPDLPSALAEARWSLRIAALDLAATSVPAERIEERADLLEQVSPDALVSLQHHRRRVLPVEWSPVERALPRRIARGWAKAARRAQLVAEVRGWSSDDFRRVERAFRRDPALLDLRSEALVEAPPLVDARFRFAASQPTMLGWGLGAPALHEGAREWIGVWAAAVRAAEADGRLKGGWRVLVEGHSRRGTDALAQRADGLTAAAEAQIVLTEAGIAPEHLATLSCGAARGATMPEGTDRAVDLSILPDGVAAPDRACGWDRPESFTPPAG